MCTLTVPQSSLALKTAPHSSATYSRHASWGRWQVHSQRSVPTAHDYVRPQRLPVRHLRVFPRAAGHTDSVEAVAFSRVQPVAVSASLDGQLLVWDSATLGVRSKCQHPQVRQRKGGLPVTQPRSLRCLRFDLPCLCPSRTHSGGPRSHHVLTSVKASNSGQQHAGCRSVGLSSSGATGLQWLP